MDKHTKAIYQRGALFVVPIVLIVGCRVGLRACVAINASERRSSLDDELRRQEEARKADEIARASATSEATQRQRARAIPTAPKGMTLAPIATGQQVPDALALDESNVAWLNTRAGEVVVAPRAGGAPRVVAREQKLPQRRHVQGLALSGGWVYWFTTSPANSEDEDGALVRIKADADSGTQPEVVLSDLGGISAIATDKDSVYFARSRRVSRDEDGGATGGVWRLRLDKKGAPIKDPKNPKQLVAAERPCAIAVDDAAVFTVEQLKVWRAPKNGGEAKAIVNGADRLGCGLAVDETSVFWTVPSDDSLMKAKKVDGSSIAVAAFVRKRPANVVVDRGYAYVIAETSPQALGELGSVFRVPARSEQLAPTPLVTDQVGLQSVAAGGGIVVFSAYNESETDGVVTKIANDPLAVDAGRP
ncbi:MAG: hypothetical protein JST00_00170 [Deltaproteobacteria bacterium]|nr:hypothetical protein [Deltaproteobacteria bacterium]